MIFKMRIFLILFISILNAQKTPIIIDADTANEVDDLFALSGALSEPNFNIIGITASQFNTSPLASLNTALESKKINDKILQLVNISIPSLLGSPNPINNITNVENSEASSFIIENARLYSSKNPLHIIILGSCTNVATAIINAPDIVKNIKVFYLGFWHDPLTNSYNKNEFNTRNDPLAINFLLDYSGLDFTVMSATTSQHLVFNRNELEVFLSDNNSLGSYLIDRWDSYKRWWTDEDKENKHWIMWDIAIIEAIANNNNSEFDLFDTPSENLNRKIKIFTKINVLGIKKRYWEKLQSFNKIYP
jgi:inosine-uridine nucleoside N-ribohydrolase